MSTTKTNSTNFCIFVTSLSVSDVIDCNTISGQMEHDTIIDSGFTGSFFWYKTREEAEKAKGNKEKELR